MERVVLGSGVAAFNSETVLGLTFQHLNHGSLGFKLFHVSSEVFRPSEGESWHAFRWTTFFALL